MDTLDSDFLKSYVRYSVASLVWGSGNRSVYEFANQYFVNQPVLYHNIQYAQVFNDFFSVYFESQIKSKNRVTEDALEETVVLADVNKLDKLFSKDSILKLDGRVRQLVELVVLRRLYHRKGFEKKHVVALLKQVAQTSNYIENRAVAQHILKKITYLSQNTMAPDFVLPDFTGHEFSLKDFRGKYVLLTFFESGSAICLAQWNQVMEMQEKLGVDFLPVVIVSGSDTAPYQKLFLKQNQSFPFLLLGNDILLLEKYQVKTYPTYILIHPDGTIAMAPAPMPEENALQIFTQTINDHKKTN